MLRGRATSISQNEIFIRTELALNYYTKQPFEKKYDCTVYIERHLIPENID